MKIIFLLLIVISCTDKGSSEKNIRSQRSEQNPVEIEIEAPEVPQIDIDQLLHGQYLAPLDPINFNVTGKIYGAFVFSRDVESKEDEVVMDIHLNRAGANVVHVQSLKEYSRCPTLDDDENQDGIIDIIEAEAVMGKTLVPMDGDISTQASHDGEYPVGDQYGNYIYSKYTEFNILMDDLRDHYSPYPEYKKLTAEEYFDIESRSVLVQGIDPSIALPSTVRTRSPLSAHQSLPIACGVITKILSPPGSDNL